MDALYKSTFTLLTLLYRQTDTHTDRQTQTDFIICPMLYAIAMGQIIIVVMPFCICKYSQQHFFHGAVVLCRLGSVNKVWRCANDD